jgi:hypothetical protein
MDENATDFIFCVELLAGGGFKSLPGKREASQKVHGTHALAG